MLNSAEFSFPQLNLVSTKRINSELHTRLQAELMDVMSTIPPILNEKRKANDALTAATIEASLVKLSLFRAQAHHKLFGFGSDTQPDATMAHYLSPMIN
ncbi:hypothetical protein GYMLUDRAFT_608326 [Collybiopsis luxurians FD-317 M1]|uniref:Uncharacterized protein n=1 Tax=Collybiopsis luxurians FD-317 M1 TaxID=944289 RepID=A0A0D0CWH3_9AGAR|nr:hypothetical protein GYMLUDRAFT_608326 [Collybiopsis luxurians FD-317 M1]